MTAQTIFRGKNIVLSLLLLLVYLMYSSLQTPDSTLSQLLSPQPTALPVITQSVEEDVIEEHEPDETSKSGQDVAGVSVGRQTANVVKVIDGDTIEVSIDGTNEKIRIIGLNTPETVDPRRPVQCFGKEASNFVKQTLTGKTVQLGSDPSQQDRDKYGRLLRYVWTENRSVDFGKFMIQEGYGQEYTYEVPYKYQVAYQNAEQNARELKKGLWSDMCIK